MIVEHMLDVAVWVIQGDRRPAHDPMRNATPYSRATIRQKTERIAPLRKSVLSQRTAAWSGRQHDSVRRREKGFISLLTRA